MLRSIPFKVEKDFIARTGDPTNTGRGGAPGPAESSIKKGPAQTTET